MLVRGDLERSDEGVLITLRTDTDLVDQIEGQWVERLSVSGRDLAECVALGSALHRGNGDIGLSRARCRERDNSQQCDCG